MYISNCNYHRPQNIAEAIKIMSTTENSAIIAGGTDLVVEIKKGIRQHSNLISISGINELKSITETGDSVIIGSGVTHNEIIKSDVILKNLPGLVMACKKIGSEQVRNVATIGGNICTAASCCDSAPVLIAYNAEIEITSADGIKTLPLKDFFVFNKKTVLKSNEIVSKIIVPKCNKGTGIHYEKFGLREAMSISVVSVAVMLNVNNNIITNCNVVIGAVAPTPRISQNATNLINNKDINELQKEELLEQIGSAASADSIPIDDIRAGAQYRRDVLKILTKRAVLNAIKNIK